MEPTSPTRLTDDDIKTVWPQGGGTAAQLQDADETDTTDGGDSADGVDAGDQTDGTDAGGGDTDSTDA
ncbi:MAG: hypothetical protein M3N24_06350 [Actinomycetota bacterium]|nr:hypothetical protein [Actinomycetota bacterium]